ncbi:acyl-CoA dehydrogenase family protein [Nocardia cyriacigeorgica]|jgi:alkylation response protein AidB-like acyl-CoA dehydrogenase|uniref:acyl-CoA dehydrogenase family protein n=2 Tax=Nocardia cyriacigeorgica TaxID=135487 RepID=UPI000CE9DB51|nr:acyl-CoA dehydrogenase family protein [Nocardia cyriacigeorgica]AVH21057.1 acyl-CoA dehydrogenase [Nocardia cyriacigeorgica]PPJ03910.1 acyl-CoA dehydrogenase [Nocardia cyriacigeorgica]
MRFALSPEHVDFAASIRKLLDAGKTPAAVRSWAAGEHAAGRALLEQLAGAGVFGLAVAEEFDGIGAEPIDLVVAFGELGRSAVPGPVVESAAAIPALLQALAGAGAADAAARWLPGIAAGTTLGTIAFTTPGRGAVALDADVADLILIADGDRLHTGTVGEQVRSVDPARRLFTVVPDELIAEGAHVADAIAAGFDAGALAAAAQLLGAGSGLLDAATEYAKQRKQFGRPIGEFQAVKQKLADVLIALDLAEPLLHRAALTAGGPDRARDLSAALVACGNAAHLAARTGLQVHGAIGYTAEYDLSLLLTKVTALRSAWGTADFHRARIAEALRSTAGASA